MFYLLNNELYYKHSERGEFIILMSVNKQKIAVIPKDALELYSKEIPVVS